MEEHVIEDMHQRINDYLQQQNRGHKTKRIFKREPENGGRT